MLLPVEAASARRAKAVANGLELFRTILPDLEEFAVGLGIWMPFQVT